MKSQKLLYIIGSTVTVLSAIGIIILTVFLVGNIKAGRNIGIEASCSDDASMYNNTTMNNCIDYNDTQNIINDNLNNNDNHDAINNGQITTITSEVDTHNTTESNLNNKNKKSKKIYYIKSGDTLCGISTSTGYSVDEIAELNKIRDVNLIYADSVLRIPD